MGDSRLVQTWFTVGDTETVFSECDHMRARAVEHFMVGGVITSVVGNPITGFILQFMEQVGGLWGWQCVFLLEGLPAGPTLHRPPIFFSAA